MYRLFTSFTMFTIAQTVSVESVTCPVNTFATARILTVFSIGLIAFWKEYCIMCNYSRANGICYQVVLISVNLSSDNTQSQVLKNVALNYKLPIEQSWPIQPALQEHRPSVCRQVFTVRRTKQGTVCTVIPRLTSYKNQEGLVVVVILDLTS